MEPVAGPVRSLAPSRQTGCAAVVSVDGDLEAGPRRGTTRPCLRVSGAGPIRTARCSGGSSATTRPVRAGAVQGGVDVGQGGGDLLAVGGNVGHGC